MSEEKYYAATSDTHPKPSTVNVTVTLAEADKAAAFVAGFRGEITPDEERRVRRKIDWHLMPLMCVLYLVQFADKTTLGASAILGLKTDTHLSATQYNWLGTIFYIAYLVFEWPQTVALQKLPPATWMSFNILAWGIVLCCHAACHNFAGLFVVRLFLGACEGSITAGFLIVTNMFYTHVEAARRVGFWFLMNGSAQIVTALISYGVYHMDPNKFAPWRLFMLIFGGITLVLGAVFYLFLPNNPMEARFLTRDEKVIAIERLRSQSTGIEHKSWKREQFIEALTDWKVWAFFLFACIAQLPNSLTNQRQLIVKSFGFTVGQTTLLGMVDGVIEILVILSATAWLKRYPNARHKIAPLYYLPNALGAILIIALPWSNQGGLLAGIWLTGFAVVGFVFALSWCPAVNTGHTKKTTASALMLIGYCVGNLVAPQMWMAKYQPRYYVPWAICLFSYVTCPIILFAIGRALKRENARRDRLAAQGHQDPKYLDENGVEIDPTFLDLTDRQLLSYRYPL